MGPEQKPKPKKDDFDPYNLDTKNQSKSDYFAKGKAKGMTYRNKGKSIQNSNTKKSMSEWVPQGMPQGSLTGDSSMEKENSPLKKKFKFSEEFVEKYSFSEDLNNSKKFEFKPSEKSTNATSLLESTSHTAASNINRGVNSQMSQPTTQATNPMRFVPPKVKPDFYGDDSDDDFQ